MNYLFHFKCRFDGTKIQGECRCLCGADEGQRRDEHDERGTAIPRGEEGSDQE